MAESTTVTLNNGVSMPRLGLGTWRASDDDVAVVVAAALEAGYRLIDTAMIYRNEVGIGRGLAATNIPREDLFITTKVWNSDQGYGQTLQAFETSRQKLGLDYLDLYLIHWPLPVRDTMLNTWRALEKLYTDKRVRAIGVCNFREEDLEKLLVHCTVPPAINQIELHPDFAQTELQKYCQAHDIIVESWSPIGGSHKAAALLDQPILRELAETHGKSPAQIVIRWHLQTGLVVIPKTVHAERMRENIDVFDFELSADDMTRIAALDSPNHRLGADPATVNNV